MIVAGARASGRRTEIVELAVKSRLPAIYENSLFVDAGGLMTYSASITDLTRRAATYVDKILKNAKPADLPVEQPTKFEFVANLKTAKQIGLTIPPNLLARADRVISDDCGFRIANFGLGEKTMERVWIKSSEMNLKSALRNLKSAILLSAMLFAL